jgi:hypothetical protein
MSCKGAGRRTENRKYVNINIMKLNNYLNATFFSILITRILSNPLFDYPSRDSGIFIYIGSLIIKGKLPYVSAWENKGPLVFYINTLGLLLSGGSLWGIWFLEFLFLMGSLYLSYRVTRENMGDVPALVGAFVWTSAVGMVFEGGNLSEEYALLFYFLAVWAFMKGDGSPAKEKFDYLIGISLGLSFLLRPNNVSLHIATVATYFVLALLFRNWQIFWKRILYITLGGLTVILPVIIFFAVQGALSEMIRVVILFNYQYSDTADSVSIFKGIRIAFESIGIQYSVLALIGFVTAFVTLLKRDALKSSLGKLMLLMLIGWPIEMILSTLSGRNYRHYFIVWAPYLGFFSSYVVYVYLHHWLRRNERFWTYATIVILSVIALWGSRSVWNNYGTAIGLKFSDPKASVDYHSPVADYLKKNTLPSDKVLVWGFRPIIYFMSEREAPASFLPYPLIHVDTPLGHSWANQFYAQFTTTPPVLIVDMANSQVDPIPAIDEKIRRTQRRTLRDAVLAPNLDQVFEYIETNYVLVGEVDGYPIYKLKTSIP